MRADHGSQSWRYPACLSYAQPDTIRRGSQQDILARLRRLLAPPAGEDARRCPADDAPSLGTRLAGESPS